MLQRYTVRRRCPRATAASSCPATIRQPNGDRLPNRSRGCSWGRRCSTRARRASCSSASRSSGAPRPASGRTQCPSVSWARPRAHDYESNTVSNLRMTPKKFSLDCIILLSGCLWPRAEFTQPRIIVSATSVDIFMPSYSNQYNVYPLILGGRVACARVLAVPGSGGGFTQPLNPILRAIRS